MRIIQAAVVLLVLAVPLAIIAYIKPTGNTATPQSGCMRQWMFNGIWRVQITKVEPLIELGTQVGWQVTEVWRNGTSVELAPATDTFMNDQQLELANGQWISTNDTTEGTLSNEVVGYEDLPPSGQFTQVEKFYPHGHFNPANEPSAVYISFDASELAQHKDKPQFTVGRSDFEVRLTCSAPVAQQRAAGGSTGASAAEGCTGQPLSNGVWQMAEDSIAPDKGDGSQQIGWAVTETWTNVTDGSWTPDDSFIGDQRLVLASGDSIPSSNTADTELSAQQLDYRLIGPRSSCTYVQLFRPDIFNPSDTPVDLLVVFDAATLRKHTDKPQFVVSVPDFRIKLVCPKAPAAR